MTVKLDMGRAWNDAVAQIKANRDVILIVAGVFFLLPNLAMSLLMPLPPEAPAIPAGAQPDFAPLMAEMSAWMADVWWIVALVVLMQAVGTLGLLALLTDRARPTVGEALGFGIKAMPTYLATQIITGVAAGVLFGAILLLGQASPAIGVILGLLLVLAMFYAMLKLSLVTPVIAIEKQLNPLAAMRRSWRLTKGNSLLILAFFLLLVVAFLVISMVAGLVFMAFSLLGDEVGLIVSALGNGVLTMAMVVVMVAALAGVHHQLSGSDGATRATFE